VLQKCWGKERVKGVNKIEVNYIYVYMYENSIRKPTTNCQKGGDKREGVKKE
jgi:hypothetical protein